MATFAATFINPDGSAQESQIFQFYLREYQHSNNATQMLTKKLFNATTNGSGELSVSLGKGLYRMVGPTGDQIDFEIPKETGSFRLENIAPALSTIPTYQN